MFLNFIQSCVFMWLTGQPVTASDTHLTSADAFNRFNSTAVIS